MKANRARLSVFLQWSEVEGGRQRSHAFPCISIRSHVSNAHHAHGRSPVDVGTPAAWDDGRLGRRVALLTAPAGCAGMLIASNRLVHESVRVFTKLIQACFFVMGAIEELGYCGIDFSEPTKIKVRRHTNSASPAAKTCRHFEWLERTGIPAFKLNQRARTKTNTPSPRRFQLRIFKTFFAKTPSLRFFAE